MAGNGDDGNDPNASTVTLKGTFKIPPYSGHLQGTTYQSTTGPKTEIFKIQDFTRQVDIIAKAAKWDDDVAASYVQLAFVPDSPVHDWYSNNHEEDFMKNWTTLRPKLITEFAAYVSVSDKVDIIRSFKQKSTEQVSHYLQRITKQYTRFLDDLEEEMTRTGSTWHGENDNQKAARRKVVDFVTDYHLKSFWALGLKPEILADVTKSGKASLADMLDVAKMTEQAQSQSVRRHTIAQVDQDATEEESNPPAHLTEDMVIAALRKMNFRPRGRGTRRGSYRPAPTVTCHYCNIRGHFADECRKRRRDRQQGIWRQKIDETPTTKEEWERARKSANQEIGTVSAETSFAEYFSKN